MRRLKQSRLQTFYLRPRTVTYDSEGVPVETFGAAIALQGEVWPATDRQDIEMYGDRITGVQKVWLQGSYYITASETGVTQAYLRDGVTTLSLGDGLCVNVGSADEPDYRVRTITPYKLLKLEIERR